MLQCTLRIRSVRHTPMCGHLEHAPLEVWIHHDKLENLADLVKLIAWGIVIPTSGGEVRPERINISIVSFMSTLLIALAMLLPLASDAISAVPHQDHSEQRLGQLAELDCNATASLSHCSSSMGLLPSFEVVRLVRTMQDKPFCGWLTAALHGVEPTGDPPPPRFPLLDG